jgi:hypothetical protein
VIDLLHIVETGEDHRRIELVAKDIDRTRDAGLPARAEAAGRPMVDTYLRLY